MFYMSDRIYFAFWDENCWTTLSAQISTLLRVSVIEHAPLGLLCSASAQRDLFSYLGSVQIFNLHQEFTIFKTFNKCRCICFTDNEHGAHIQWRCSKTIIGLHTVCTPKLQNPDADVVIMVIIIIHNNLSNKYTNKCNVWSTNQASFHQSQSCICAKKDFGM